MNAYKFNNNECMCTSIYVFFNRNHDFINSQQPKNLVIDNLTFSIFKIYFCSSLFRYAPLSQYFVLCKHFKTSIKRLLLVLATITKGRRVRLLRFESHVTHSRD